MIQGVPPAFDLVNRIDKDILCNAKTCKRPVDSPSLQKSASALSKRSVFDNKQVNIRFFMNLTTSVRTKQDNSHRIYFPDYAFRHLINNAVVYSGHNNPELDWDKSFRCNELHKITANYICCQCVIPD